MASPLHFRFTLYIVNCTYFRLQLLPLPCLWLAAATLLIMALAGYNWCPWACLSWLLLLLLLWLGKSLDRRGMKQMKEAGQSSLTNSSPTPLFDTFFSIFALVGYLLHQTHESWTVWCQLCSSSLMWDHSHCPILTSPFHQGVNEVDETYIMSHQWLNIYPPLLNLQSPSHPHDLTEEPFPPPCTHFHLPMRKQSWQDICSISLMTKCLPTPYQLPITTPPLMTQWRTISTALPHFHLSMRGNWGWQDVHNISSTTWPLCTPLTDRGPFPLPQPHFHLLLRLIRWSQCLIDNCT